MEAVQRAVDVGIKNLNGAGVMHNQAPFEAGGDHTYVMPARTREEIIGTPAADQGNVARPNAQQVAQAHAAQVAVGQGNVDMFAHLAQVADPNAQPLGQPSNVPPAIPVPIPEVTRGGLILPPGVEAPSQAAPSAPATWHW